MGTMSFEDRFRVESDWPASVLLRVLQGHGVGYMVIAEVCGVTVATVRGWLRGHDVPPLNKVKLVRFVALLETLEAGGIEEPAAWMETDLPLEAGYYVRPSDLWDDSLMVDYADGRITTIELLDHARALRPRSDWEVFTDTDGRRSIRLRAGVKPLRVVQ